MEFAMIQQTLKNALMMEVHYRHCYLGITRQGEPVGGVVFNRDLTIENNAIYWRTPCTNAPFIISGDCCLLNDDAFQKCSDCECLYDPVEIMSTAKQFPSGMFSKTDGMIDGMDGLTYGETDFSLKT